MSTQSPNQPTPALTMQRARQLEIVHRAVTEGLVSAASQLTRFVGKDIAIEAPRLGLCPIDQMVDCALGTAFEQAPEQEAEAIKTGIYLSIAGDVEGHFLMLLDPADARSLVEPLIHELALPADEVEDMVISALGEVGNITSCSVLNALADATGLRIGPSCPAVVTDMAGAILEMPMLDVAQFADEALYIETQIAMASMATTGALALIPRPEGLEVLIQGLMRARKKGARQ
jgi:chemotaxis protein CheC